MSEDYVILEQTKKGHPLLQGRVCRYDAIGDFAGPWKSLELALEVAQDGGMVASSAQLMQAKLGVGLYHTGSNLFVGEATVNGESGQYGLVVHSGVGLNPILSPEVLQNAFSRFQEDKSTAYTKTSGIKLEEAFGKGIFQELVEGRHPEGSSYEVVHIDNVLAGDASVDTFLGGGIVFPLKRDNYFPAYSKYSQVSIRNANGLFSLVLATAGGNDAIMSYLQKPRAVALFNPVQMPSFASQVDQGYLIGIGEGTYNLHFAMVPFMNGINCHIAVEKEELEKKEDNVVKLF